MTHRKIIIIWKPIAQTLYIKHMLFVMNKDTKGDMAYNLPLKKYESIEDVGLIWLRKGIIGELFWMQHWTSGFQKPFNYDTIIIGKEIRKTVIKMEARYFYNIKIRKMRHWRNLATNTELGKNLLRKTKIHNEMSCLARW